MAAIFFFQMQACQGAVEVCVPGELARETVSLSNSNGGCQDDPFNQRRHPAESDVPTV
jgi:hypothetical protein